MNIKLLSEHHCLSILMSRCHIVGKHMSQLRFVYLDETALSLNTTLYNLATEDSGNSWSYSHVSLNLRGVGVLSC